MCNITYRGVAVSTPEGRTTVSYDATYLVNKELLSQVLNTVLRVRERDSRQVGDPFITPYLAGVYQRLGLEYSSLLCFTRITLLWRRISAARAAAAAAAAAPRSAAMAAAAAAAARRAAAAAEPAAADSAPAGAAAAATRPGARVASLDWHVQQLHRELVLEPWKAADLRLMLGRAAAYAEVQLAAGGSSSSAAGAAGPGVCSATGGSGGGSVATGGSLADTGIPGPWLPRHASALVGGGMRVGGSGSGGGGAGEGETCSGPQEGLAALGRPGGLLHAVLFWALWAACPTVLVALEAMQAAPDNPWMALYICVIATCRTMAEWRATASLALARGLTPAQRLYGMAAVHLASGLASIVVTGLLNTWLPLLGHGAAAAVVWLHLLLLPAVMVAVMGVAGMPSVALHLAGGNGAGRADGGAHRHGVRDRRQVTAAFVAGGGIGFGGGAFGNDPLGANPGRRAARELERMGRVSAGGAGSGGGDGVGPGGGGGGTGSRGGVSAAAAAAAQVHWPPALEVPAWLDDWPNAPEAFRCPITQSLMREPAQASSGVTYERPAIMQWLEHRRVDPVTHVPLKRHRLAPNLNLRHMIEVWVQDRVEARRRLAQRLREEVSAEMAALAAAEAAAAGAATSADGSPATAPTTTADESSSPEATQNDPGAADAAAASLGPAAMRLTCGGGADADGAAAAGAPVTTGAPSRSEAASATTAATATATGSAQPAAVQTAAGGGVGGIVSESESQAPGSGAAAVLVRVEEVEALAAAAARARIGCRRRCPGLGDGGCGGNGSGGLLPALGRRYSGGGRLAHGGDTDGVFGVEDGGASTAGSGESPFAVAPVARDSSGREADTEAGTDPPGAESGGGGGEGSSSYLYDTAFGAVHAGGAGLAGTAGLAADGLPRRRHSRRRSSAAGSAGMAAPAAAVGALPRVPSWGMVWDGADPDNSDVLAVDGSTTSTAVVASAPTSRDRLAPQDPLTHHQHYQHQAQQQQLAALRLAQPQPQQPHPHSPPQSEGRVGRSSDGGQAAAAAPAAPSPGPSGATAAATRPTAAAPSGGL